MISVQEVIVDPDMTAPQFFTVLRSTGQYVPGGFQSTVLPIQAYGPVQQASPKEIAMLPEADRVSGMRSFWTTFPVYVTRGSAYVPSVHGETPAGDVPGTVYTLSTIPAGTISLWLNGDQLTPGVDYFPAGNVITLAVPTTGGDQLWAQWPVTVQVTTQGSASDKIVYDSITYRVVSVYNDPGGGYWKAVAAREAAA